MWRPYSNAFKSRKSSAASFTCENSTQKAATSTNTSDTATIAIPCFVKPYTPHCFIHGCDFKASPTFSYVLLPLRVVASFASYVRFACLTICFHSFSGFVASPITRSCAKMTSSPIHQFRNEDLPTFLSREVAYRQWLGCATSFA